MTFVAVMLLFRCCGVVMLFIVPLCVLVVCHSSRRYVLCFMLVVVLRGWCDALLTLLLVCRSAWLPSCLCVDMLVVFSCLAILPFCIAGIVVVLLCCHVGVLPLSPSSLCSCWVWLLL